VSSADRVVVFGGAGFIGRRLVRRLLEAGNEVMVVSRSSGSRRSTDPRLSYEAGSVTDAARVLELIDGATVVYDLSMTGGATWEDIEREVIGGAANVARACVKHGVRRLIYTSSIAALDMSPAGILDDDVPNDGNDPGRGFYSRGKSMSERKVLEIHKQDGLSLVIFRPAIVVGPGGKLAHYALGDATASDTCLLGWGPGNHPLPFVLVDDVAEAMYLGKDAAEANGLSFNLAGDVRPTAAEFVAALRERSRRNFRFYPRSLRMIYRGEVVRSWIKKLAGKPSELGFLWGDVSGLSMRRQFDCSRAKRVLGWRPLADREEFFRQTIDGLLPPMHPGDMRLEIPV
jgi:nucleoside-diphosphate-sugar epimerase